MTRIAIRHTLLALAALAFVSAFAGSLNSAQAEFEIQRSMSAFTQGDTLRTQASKAPKRLATKKGGASLKRLQPNSLLGIHAIPHIVGCGCE